MKIALCVLSVACAGTGILEGPVDRGGSGWSASVPLETVVPVTSPDGAPSSQSISQVIPRSNPAVSQPPTVPAPTPPTVPSPSPVPPNQPSPNPIPPGTPPPNPL